jgi:hypothetical protein
LEAYLRATSRALQRYYIDCFAGRGAWQTEDGQEFKGSPLQAIEAQAAAGVMFTQLHFIERLPRVTSPACCKKRGIWVILVVAKQARKGAPSPYEEDTTIPSDCPADS